MSVSKLFKAFGFSLIELMVVIVIVAILAAVSIPSYYSYINRTKISESVSVASYWLNEALTYFHTNDVLPASNTMVMSPTSIYTSTYLLGDTNGPYAIYYWRTNNTAAIIYVAVAGLSGITDYIDPTSLPLDGLLFSNAHYSVVAMGLRIVNDMAEFQCGTRTAGDYMSIPLDMLPSACTCANVSVWTGGGAC